MRVSERRQLQERPVSAARLLERLRAFHRSKVDKTLRSFSPIVSRTVGFNQSPFYERDCKLADRQSSYWGIDRCLRINETIDPFHSRIFHVGAFSCAVDSKQSSHPPASDVQFAELQRATFAQFFSLLDWLALSRNRLTATYFGGAELGGQGDGRDRSLKKRHRFPRDEVSARALDQFGIRATGIATIANMDIAPFEGALVGPRVDIYCEGVELATILFNCYKLRRGSLERINYVAGYGIGLERLLSVLSQGDFLSVVPRYCGARRRIERQSKAARSPTMTRDVLQVIFGLEVLAHLPTHLSRAHEVLVRRMKVQMKPSIYDLGLSFDHITEIYQWFRNTRADKSI